MDRPWRSGGMGPSVPGPIPHRDVVAWCAFYDLTGDDVDYLDACFREMDQVFLAHYADQVKRAMARP